MTFITLKDYAQKHGKAERTVRQKAQLGNFETAVKVGRDWLIDEDEPYVDKRRKVLKNYKEEKTEYIGSSDSMSGTI